MVKLGGGYKVLINNGIQVIPVDNELKDYKIFCFHGEPKFFKVHFGRSQKMHVNYYDVAWNLLPMEGADYTSVPEHVEEPPANFNEMLAVARKLSRGHAFLRVDLYAVNGKTYFGETTFYPASGFCPYVPDKWDEILGSWINLNNLN
jgi:hypothetical protein